MEKINRLERILSMLYEYLYILEKDKENNKLKIKETKNMINELWSDYHKILKEIFFDEC